MNSHGVSAIQALPVYESTSCLCLELAGRRFRLVGIPAGWSALLPPRLLDRVVQPGDLPEILIEVEMSTEERLRPPDEPHDLNHTTQLFFTGEDVFRQGDWSEGSFRRTMDTPVHLLVHVDAAPWFGGVLENFLRVLVAYDVLECGGVLLHSAAIVKNGRAAVMFGHSGAGKSTASAIALANGYSVISDDINIIEPAGDGWQVTPVPFSGTLNAVSEIKRPVPLLGLFRLRQAGKDAVLPCSAARSVSLLAGSVPFVNQDPLRADLLLDILTGLCVALPVQDLYFTPNDNFLRNVLQTIA